MTAPMACWRDLRRWSRLPTRASSPVVRWRWLLSPMRRARAARPMPWAGSYSSAGLPSPTRMPSAALTEQPSARSSPASAMRERQPPGAFKPHAYLELHIEQGPILEREGSVIGAVEAITGLTWTEVTLIGQAAHAGTTPMLRRRDAAHAAAETVLFVRRLAAAIAGNAPPTA